MEQVLNKIDGLLLQRKKDVFTSNFPDIIEQWSQRVVDFKQHSVLNGSEDTHLIQKLELFHEKLESFIQAKADVSVFQATKFTNDIYSVYYTLQSLLSSSTTTTTTTTTRK
jgi:hypothetical protein